MDIITRIFRKQYPQFACSQTLVIFVWNRLLGLIFQQAFAVGVVAPTETCKCMVQLDILVGNMHACMHSLSPLPNLIIQDNMFRTIHMTWYIFLVSFLFGRSAAAMQFQHIVESSYDLLCCNGEALIHLKTKCKLTIDQHCILLLPSDEYNTYEQTWLAFFLGGTCRIG